MKKKIVIVILVLALSLSLAAAVTACKPKEEPHMGKITVDITSEADFLAIKDKVGKPYDEATFALKKGLTFDIADGAWSPIGETHTASFRSTFQGNGHTVTLKLRGEDGRFLQTGGVLGLFGYLYGATLENFTLNIDYSIDTQQDLSFVGGLAGFAAGKNTFRNVHVNGIIDAQPSYDGGFDEDGNELSTVEKSAYIGGLAAYATGETLMSDCSASVKFRAAERATAVGRYRYTNVYAGGAGAYVRTTDISLTNLESDGVTSKERNSIANLAVQAEMFLQGASVYAGGAFGLIYNADVKDVSVAPYAASSELDARGKVHNYVGGAFGFLDNCAATDIAATVPVRLSPDNADGKRIACSMGGVAGYITGGTVLKNAAFTGSLFVLVDARAEAYAGGIVGTMNGSTVQNSTAAGGFVVSADGTDAATLLAVADGSMGVNAMAQFLAGIAGAAHGKSVIQDANADFVAYQGIVASIASTFQIIRENNDPEGKPLHVEKMDTPDIQATATFAAEKTAAYLYAEGGGITLTMQPNGYGVGVLPVAG